jgi:hypothetical protein
MFGAGRPSIVGTFIGGAGGVDFVPPGFDRDDGGGGAAGACFTIGIDALLPPICVARFIDDEAGDDGVIDGIFAGTGTYRGGGGGSTSGAAGAREDGGPGDIDADLFS